ncbi:MAG: PAS domain S-box protein, partial [Armatimonadetes bacterium]|nr:PAS domain S-box protein [Armatimonadota bacterium]
MTRGDQRNPEPAERKPFGPLGWAVVAICFLALLLNFVAWSGGSFHEVRCLSVAIGLFTILLLLVHLRVKQQLEREIAERLHVELALRRFIQHAPVPVAMLDRQMNYVIHSRRWVQDFRLGEADLAGRNHYEVFPEIPERWKEVHQRCLAGAVEVCDEDAFARRDGTMEWLRWEVLPWHEADGRIGGLILFVEMITRRKQAEQALEGALRREEAMGRFRDRVVAVRSLEDVGRLRQRWIEAVSSLGIPVRSVSFEFPSPRPGQYRTGWLAEEHASLADHPLSAYPWVQQAWETGRPVVVTRAQMGDAGGLSPEVQAILEIPLPGIGSLGVSSTKADAFAPEAIQTLQAFAGLVAEGLQRTRDFLALQESADRLRLMVQQMPAVLWTTDTDLRFTSCQGAGLEGIHLLPDQVHGLTLFEFFRTSDPEFLPIAAHRAALRGESSTYESAWMGRTF